MTDILCDWLNREVKLSRAVDPESFPKEFSSGYLIGELLHKYELQDDFNQFSQSRVASAKLNNFSRMEPTLQLLGVQFDQNVARNIMTEQHGAAIKLLYQLYIALEKKKKAGLTGVAMEAMRPSAPAKLKGIGTEIYRERLKTLVPRQADLTLLQISDNFKNKAKDMEKKRDQMQLLEQQKAKKLQEEKKIKDMEKKVVERRRQHEIMAKIQAAIIQIPKPLPQHTVQAIEAQKLLRKKREAESTYTEIRKFEQQMRKEFSVHATKLHDSMLQVVSQTKEVDGTIPAITQLLNTYSDDEYIRKIQKRLEENTFAREQREKRRRKMLQEQLVAHEAQEEAYREEQLINRLMRQSQQERRITVQLMHVRHEKEVLWQNRIYREKQFEERRLKEFQEALDREAALAKQERMELEDQAIKEKLLHAKLAAERAEARYKKHYSICWEMVEQIIDLVTKIGEYRMLTNNLIPAKLMRDWKELFLKGKPVYEQATIDPSSPEPTPLQLVELDKMNFLDEKDYNEYKTMTEEWCPLEEISANKPPPSNPILGHVIYRMRDIIYPPEPELPPPVISPFPIKGCILGKICSGKTTCLKFLEEECNIKALSIDELISGAIQAFQENELGSSTSLTQVKTEDVPMSQIDVLRAASKASILALKSWDGVEIILPDNESKDFEQRSISLKSGELSDDRNDLSKFSIRAQLGAAAETLLKRGKSIPDELLVGILVENISRLPSHQGWIINEFPLTLNQAKLLEKALTGRDPDQEVTTDTSVKKPTLVVDPTAPKEPPVFPPALDFVILLEVSDPIVLNRVASRKALADIYERGDPGANVQEREKEYTLRGHIQERIIGFLDTWPTLETWFSEHRNKLIKVNAEAEKDLLCQRVKEILLEEVVKKKKEQERKEAERKAQEVPSPVPQEEVLAVIPGKVEELEVVSSPDLPEPELVEVKEAKESPPSPTRKGKKGKKADAAKGKEAGSKPGTPRGKSPGKAVPPPPEESPAPVPVEPPPIKPGSAEWVYVDDPLPPEVPAFLVPYWEMVEASYVSSIKAVLRHLRVEQHIIIHYLSDIRNHFKEYLKRPDHKQEFVTQWQTDFNSVADDLWDDDETKEELHQRVTDLRDRLWDICENRRDEAEQERSDIMNDGWLPDRMGLLINHILSLMQCEVDRFQDTKRLLHDYYRGMEGKILTETNTEFTRIPLMDLIPGDEEGKSKIIPLLARRIPSPDIAFTKQKSKTLQVKSVKEDFQASESALFNFATDVKLISETWHNAVITISSMVSAEIQAKEAEEEKERLQQEMKEKEHQKSAQAAPGKGGKEGKGGKGGKGGKEGKGKKEGKEGKGGKEAKDSKKGKKKESAAVVEPAPVPLSPEELKKQELKLKAKQEYFTALELEAEAAKSRLELLKFKAHTFIEDLTSKAESTCRDMEKWLGERFLAEMSSVDKLVEVARHHIESSTKIQNELVLEGTEFYVNGDIKVFPDPVPPPRPPSVETATDGTPTISQLSSLHKQFLQVAPKALAVLKQFRKKDVTPGKQSQKSQQFEKIWLSKYPWLKHDSGRDVMYCALCRKHKVNLGETIHNFCTGTDDFRLELVAEHESGQAHAWANCMEAASSSAPDMTTTEQILRNMSKATLGRIENLFRTCHAIAKTGRPFTDLDWMCKLDDMKGVDIGSIFRNDKAARIFTHFIAEVERRALKEKLEQCKFFTLISDGITADHASPEAALVYVRFAFQGKVHCQIVGVQSVEQYDASAVKNAILKILQTNLQLHLPSQDWARKLVGFGSAGAHVMVGQNNGVAQLLKEIQPCVQSVHCLVHHLEMAYKETLEKAHLYTVLMGLLQNTYYFYQCSPLNKSSLKLMYEALKLRPAVPSRIGGSRWLLRLQTALQILLKGYPAIVLHISKIQEEPCSSNHQKAKDLLKLLLQADIIKFSHFLLDVINVLNILSRVAQDQNSSIADVFATIQSTQETLQMYRARSGPRERLVETTSFFHGHQLRGDGDIKEARTELLSGLLNQLRDCFCDASEEVLRASTIGSFKLWPDKMIQEFGEVEVSVLTKYYEPILERANVKVDEVETEWTMLKAELYNRYQNVRRLTWDLVNSDYSHKYPNILALVDLVLTLPASSDEAARGFCQMKLTMMQRRSKQMLESMTDLMIIQMNSPEIKKFDPQKAIQLWNISWQRNRRMEDGQWMAIRESSDCSSDSDWESLFGSLIPAKTFIDIISDLITMNLGSNLLPDSWMHLNMYDIQNMASMITVNSDIVDWRRFLQAASQPWLIPSVMELLETLQRFQAVDENRSGLITQKQYHEAGLWFKGSEDVVIPESPTEPLPFNRQEHLIKFLFTLFAGTQRDQLLDYTNMLLYFASDPDAIDGVYRALSVATGTYTHRKKEKHLPLPQVFTSPTDNMIIYEHDELIEEEEGGEEDEEEEEEKEKEDEDDFYTNAGIISLATVLRVFKHETMEAADNHRFSDNLTEKDNYEHFIKIYKELGAEDLEPITVALLLKHPFIQDLVNSYQGYKLPDFKMILQRQPMSGEAILL